MVTQLLKSLGINRKTVAHPLFKRPLRTLSTRGWISYRSVKGIPVREDFSVTLPDHGAFRYRLTSGDEIGSLLYWRGLRGWSAPTVKKLIEMAPQISFFLDVGANTGVLTMIASLVNPRLRSIALEPSPKIVRILKDNIRLNGLESRCNVHAEAVGDHCGTARFNIPADSSTMGSFEGGTHDEPGGNVIEVPMVTVDSVVPAGVRVDLAKIDVEGFEHLVLQGMKRVLAESKPTIIIECLPGGPFASVEEILAGYGYRFAHIGDQGIVSTEHIRPDATRKNPNFLCTPA
jgi:FkbM family methyltransferase